MHIAICKLLEPYGYYEFDFYDTDGWPHYKIITDLPHLKAGEQTVLMKEAIVNYFQRFWALFGLHRAPAPTKPKNDPREPQNERPEAPEAKNEPQEAQNEPQEPK